MANAPRLSPLSQDELTDDQRQLLDAFGGEKALNIFKTLVRHPGLFRQWLPFGGKLLQGGKLPPRERELIILRTAYVTGAEYEWAQHVAMAQAAGVTDEEIERIAAGAAADGWSADDSMLLRAVDEVLSDRRISDDAWSALAARYDERQLIEVPMVAGHYSMLAGVLNTIGVEPEASDFPPLGRAAR